MREVVIVSGVRTAIGSFGGTLKDTPVVQLGALVIREALQRVGLRPETSPVLLDIGPEALKGEKRTVLDERYGQWDAALKPVQVDEVIMGNVLQAGLGQNSARQATIYAGLPRETNACTVNKICASGLKAITLAAQTIGAGQADVMVAGGMENMSLAPYSLPKARWGYRMDVSSKGEIIDLMVFDGLWEIFYGYHMGLTAENIAERCKISRQEQDELSLMSQQRAMAAIKNGIFKEEIVPVKIPQKKGDPVIFDTDEFPKDTSLEKMAKLPPVFKKDGTVTAGNASGINDAAAAVVLMTKEKAKELGVKPLVTIRAFASGGVDPSYMGLGPVPAVKKVLKATGLSVKDIDVVELNEAFASQAIACIREMGFDRERTNIHGSGISLGHPIGCTGARVTVTLINEMRRRKAKYGLCTMCIGGGQGMAMLVEAQG